jgi:hypothetical protein
MKKDDVQEVARARFEAMEIPLATRFKEPISALKADLQILEKDAIALLKGECVFILQLQNSENVVGKVEKML